MTQEISLPLVYLNTTPLNPTLAQVLGGQAAPTTTQATGANGAPAGQQGTGSSPNIMFFGIIMMVGMFLIMSMSGRKEKKKRAAMLKELAKRDKVRTAGGIIGTIIEIKDDEVLLETDKSSHTRLWLARGSVSTILDSSKRAKEDSASDADAQLDSVS
ncbi:preprotein translocase subunit YajC [bacterium]|nr:MAG: preprotein translocase subunit YajC [bacterium]